MLPSRPIRGSCAIDTPEALTESFCERCGTRYEFAAPTRLNTIRKTRGLIAGLKNYIMSQDALSDAVGDALRSEEEALAAQQLEAFHRSFNFCINCRQYACTNCWNDDAGRCRTCAPIPGTDDLIERFEASFQAQHPELTAVGEPQMDEAELNRRLGLEAWPSADLERVATNGHVDVEWPVEELQPAAASDEPVEPMSEPEPVVAEAVPEPVVAEQPAPEPVVAETEPEPEPELPPLRLLTWEEDAPIELEPEPIVAEPELEPMAAGAEIAAEVEAQPLPAGDEPAPEPVVAEVEPAPEPEPVVAEAEPEPEPVISEGEPEPVAAEAESKPEPEPVAAASEVEPEPAPEPPEPPAPRPIVPIRETILRVPRREPEPEAPAEPVAAEREDPALAARRAKLDLLGLGDPGEGPVTPQRTVLPYRSSGAAVHPAELAARSRVGRAAATSGFWEASAREVAGAISHVGVKNCGQCGLSLSASARFCRRCGTSQAA
ncbi:MAG TPA: hypothetical protein VFH63_05545 [candidate division Zixibacteria bacterium]|nr:hypothetical protein [candidate division Zixibacteria bacterium]